MISYKSSTVTAANTITEERSWRSARLHAWWLASTASYVIGHV